MIALIAMLLVSAGAPANDAEVKRVTQFVEEVCAPVKETPEMFLFRAFPLGPLSLEVRRAATPEEAKELRNVHLGIVAGACGLEADEVTEPFACGPECVTGRRQHLVSQLTRLRTVAEGFRRTSLKVLAIWAPKGDLRVDDVFVLDGVVREAVPSAIHGFVPSGEWKDLESLDAYLGPRKVDGGAVLELADGMRGMGVSALVREGDRLRVVGVGIGDNESGLLLGAGSEPGVGSLAADGRRYQVVERVAPDAVFYETN